MNYYYNNTDIKGMPSNIKINHNRILENTLDSKNFKVYNDIIKKGLGLFDCPDNQELVGFFRTQNDLDRRVPTFLTLHKYFTRILEYETEFHLEDLKIMASQIKGVPLKSEAKIVNGDEIYEAYKTSYGIKSCMCGPDRAEFTRVYALNKDICYMVKVTSPVTARAMLWKCNDGTWVLDRIYARNDKCINIAKKIMIDLLKNNGYNFSFRSEKIKQVELKMHSNFKMPYLDTFAHIIKVNSDSLVLTNEYTGYTAFQRQDGVIRFICAFCSSQHIVNHKIDFNAIYQRVDTNPKLPGNHLKFFCCESCRESYYRRHGLTIDKSKEVVKELENSRPIFQQNVFGYNSTSSASYISVATTGTRV